METNLGTTQGGTDGGLKIGTPASPTASKNRVFHRECETCGAGFKSYKGSGQGRFCSIRCRFLGSVDVFGECWGWMAAVSGKGYGKLSLLGRDQAAHRYAYEIFFGPVPRNRLVLHRCDNRRCVNPEHLFVGSAKDNFDDMISKGRAAWQR